MQVIILTETGPNIGFGHVSRCLSLAYAFIEQDIGIKFIVQGPNIDNFDEFADFKVTNIDWINDPLTALELIKGYEAAIFDSYNISPSFINELSRNSTIPVYIDDLGRDDYTRGIIINSANDEPDPRYLNNIHIYQLIGYKYVMLKKEYWNRPLKKIRKKINSVLITLGASDQQNLTPWIIKQLHKYGQSLKKRIVVTSFFKNTEEIIRILNEKDEIIFSPNTREMKDLMITTDLAISAAGQTSFELVSMSIPSLIIVTAINQLKNAQNLMKYGMALYTGRWDDVDLDAQFHNEFNKILSLKMRERLISNGLKYICPDGSRNAVSDIINIIKNFPNMKSRESISSEE